MGDSTGGAVLLGKDPFARVRCLSSSQLKWIALVCMVIDHIAAIFVLPWAKTEPTGAGMLAYEALRGIGRVTFVVFAYQLAVGAERTRSLPKYLGRLVAFALVSQAPYYLAVSGAEGFFFARLNIGFTLVVGAVPLLAAEAMRRSLGCTSKTADLVAAGLSVAAVLGVTLCPVHVDYGAYGVALICIFYVFRDVPIVQLIAGALVTQMYCDMTGASVQMLAVAGLALVCCLSSGERGHMGKWVCYVFYPAHLLVLGVVRMLVLA